MATAKERAQAAEVRAQDAERRANEAEARAKAAEKVAETGKPQMTSEQIEALNKQTTLRPDRTPNALGNRVEASVSGAKCWVGLKVGIAYFDLQLSELREKEEQTQTGARTIKEAVRLDGVVRVRGTAYPRGTPPEGFPEKPMIVAGCAITPNVDRDFMRAWLDQNRTSAIVKNEMIFMADSEVDAIAKARELSGELSGFDPLNVRGGDVRMPKSTNKAVGELEPGKTA